jgi:hypothetical protein
MAKRSMFVGMEVHKESIDVLLAEEGRDGGMRRREGRGNPKSRGRPWNMERGTGFAPFRDRACSSTAWQTPAPFLPPHA